MNSCPSNILAGVHENSFITIMDDDEEDPFVDVTIHVEPLFVHSPKSPKLIVWPASLT